MSNHHYHKEIIEYQSAMDKQLRAPDGWLTLAGLHWLNEEKNSIGASRTSTVTLPAYSAPQDVGDLILIDGKVHFEPREGIKLKANGDQINTKIELESDINRNPTVITLGDLSFFVILRGERVGIRVKQVSNPRRLNFPGRVWWPVNENFRVKALIERYEPKKMVSIPDILGDEKVTAMDCALKFDLGGQPFSLDVFGLPSGQYYILFHDLSCGQGSYPAGRFQVTEIPEWDTVVIDFNKAHNPPCAFTPFATCPLPPQQNYLNTTIHAGERYHDLHGHNG